MPVRVLDSLGDGDATVIAQGVGFAVRHRAQVINMSLEFTSDVTAADIPELTRRPALRPRPRRAGRRRRRQRGPRRRSPTRPAPATCSSVGATTEHGCLSNFSNDGRQLAIVAPGGGADADARPTTPTAARRSRPGATSTR